MASLISFCYAFIFAIAIYGQSQSDVHAQSEYLSNHHSPHGFVNNATLAGVSTGCKFQTAYELSPTITFQMCVGQEIADLKNGMTIINLINVRAFLPTCRVLHLLLWMRSEVDPNSELNRDLFVDIGANIGSCSNHIAALGFPVLAVEPVPQHVKTIQGTINLNPSFHIDVREIGMSSVEKVMNVTFGHGARNWGATVFEEAQIGAPYESVLPLHSLDNLISHRRYTFYT